VNLEFSSQRVCFQRLVKVSKRRVWEYQRPLDPGSLMADDLRSSVRTCEIRQHARAKLSSAGSDRNQGNLGLFRRVRCQNKLHGTARVIGGGSLLDLSGKNINRSAVGIKV
jgi:hypothetical protein